MIQIDTLGRKGTLSYIVSIMAADDLAPQRAMVLLKYSCFSTKRVKICSWSSSNWPDEEFVLIMNTWAHHPPEWPPKAGWSTAIMLTLYMVLTLFATRFAAYAGGISLFHTATSLLIWYTMFCMRYIIQTYMDEIYKYAFCVCPIWDVQAFLLMNYCGFNIESFCSEVCGDHWRPQTLAEICKKHGYLVRFQSSGH